jgi:hypothetical protein
MISFVNLIVYVHNTQGVNKAANLLSNIVGAAAESDIEAFRNEIDEVKSMFTLTDTITAPTTAKGVEHLVVRRRNYVLEEIADGFDGLAKEALANRRDDEDFVIGQTYEKAASAVRECLDLPA